MYEHRVHSNRQDDSLLVVVRLRLLLVQLEGRRAAVVAAGRIRARRLRHLQNKRQAAALSLDNCLFTTTR